MPELRGMDLERRVLEDAATQAAAQHWLELNCEQVSAGRFSGQYGAVHLDGIHLVRESHNQVVHKYGQSPAGLCFISCIVQPTAQARFVAFMPQEDSYLYFLPAATEFDAYVPAGPGTRYIAFDQRALLEAGQALSPLFGEGPPRTVLQLKSERRGLFDSTFRAVFALARGGGEQPDQEAVRRTVMHNVVYALSGAEALDAEAPSLHARRRRLHIVRAARDFTLQSLEAGHTPTVVDVCAHVGVSERTLQYSFRDTLQISPVAYLRILRLNRARAELLCGAEGATVTRTATRFGFLHLGKFALDYRRMFGESPSATLAAGKV